MANLFSKIKPLSKEIRFEEKKVQSNYNHHVIMVGNPKSRIQRNCKTKLKYTKKSDCFVGIVLKRKLYNVSHGNVNVFGIFWKVSMAV